MSRRPVLLLLLALASTGHAAAAGVSFDARHARPLAGDGFAVWSLEYRRVGDPGSGWPGTVQDVRAGSAHLAQLVEKAPLDPGRVALVDPSAGGHPVLRAGGALPEDAPVQARTHPSPARAGATVEMPELLGFGHFDRIHPRTDVLPVRTGMLRRRLAPAAAA